MLLGGTPLGTHQPWGLILELGSFSTFVLDVDDGIKNLFILASGGAGPLLSHKLNRRWGKNRVDNYCLGGVIFDYTEARKYNWGLKSKC